MPALGATDTANLAAKARMGLGFSWQIEQPWRVLPCPSRAGSSGFPVWYCELQPEKFNSGEENNLSQTSIYHWAACLEPHHQTGNGARSQIIGVDLLNLVIYITTLPDVTLDEIAAFIFSEGGSTLLPSGHLQVKWHPGQENLADYQSKHHIGTHHQAVCPWYLHEKHSPLVHSLELLD
jgi:hypothetical protein